MFPPAFFNILKEPLVVQKRMIPQKKALILSFFLEQESLRVWYHFLLTQKAYFDEFLQCMEGFKNFASYDISRRLLLSYNHFLGVIWKLRLRALLWVIVCFYGSHSSLRMLKGVGFRKWLSHTVPFVRYIWSKSYDM